MAARTLTLGDISLVVNAVLENVPLALVVFVDDKAVARICGVQEYVDGKMVLRCLKCNCIDGVYSDFTLATVGPVDEPVAMEHTTWNGKPAVCGKVDEIDLDKLAQATWGRPFGKEQLRILLNGGQIMNRLGYRPGRQAKRVRKVVGRTNKKAA